MLIDGGASIRNVLAAQIESMIGQALQNLRIGLPMHERWGNAAQGGMWLALP